MSCDIILPPTASLNPWVLGLTASPRQHHTAVLAEAACHPGGSVVIVCGKADTGTHILTARPKARVAVASVHELNTSVNCCFAQLVPNCFHVPAQARPICSARLCTYPGVDSWRRKSDLEALALHQILQLQHCSAMPHSRTSNDSAVSRVEGAPSTGTTTTGVSLPVFHHQPSLRFASSHESTLNLCLKTHQDPNS